MSKSSFSKVQCLRKERNADIIRRMNNGEQLSSFNSYSSWFPPRPVIEKDPKAVSELYGQETRTIRPAQIDVAQEKQEEATTPRLRLA